MSGILAFAGKNKDNSNSGNKRTSTHNTKQSNERVNSFGKGISSISSLIKSATGMADGGKDGEESKEMALRINNTALSRQARPSLEHRHSKGST